MPVRVPRRIVHSGKSTVGRPRRVTDAQVKVILAWRAEMVELRALRAGTKTIHQLALELGLSDSTITDVVRCGGQFKQPSPELRHEVWTRRHAAELAAREARDRERNPTAEQLAAIHRWCDERRALAERSRQCLPLHKIARHLHVAQHTVHRILLRLKGRDSVRLGGARRMRRIGRVDARCLLAWHYNRTQLAERRRRVPYIREFARQHGMNFDRLRVILRRLKAPNDFENLVVAHRQRSCTFEIDVAPHTHIAANEAGSSAVFAPP